MIRVAVESLKRGQWQQRLEASRCGRLVISLFLAVTMAAIVIEVLPEQVAAPPSVKDVTHRYIEGAGIYQNWALFTPPRNEVIELDARVTFDDGSTTMWHLPSSDPFVGSYFDYHWLKYMEHAAFRGEGNVDSWPRLWEPLARYVARDAAAPGKVPVEVTLITTRILNLPIDGDGPTSAEPRIDEYYTLDLDSPSEGG